MPENKPRVPAQAAPAGARRDTAQDFDDVTVLFAPPPELLEQTAARDEEAPSFRALPRSSWESSDDEATLAIQLTSELPFLQPLQPLPSPPAAPAELLRSQPRAQGVTLPAPSSVEIGDAELGAILGPRRAARWLALGGALTLVLVILAVARLAP
jgi:hypothetical protein